MNVIDAAYGHLLSLGWSCGEMAYYVEGVIVWQVFAHHGDQRIVARARSQSDAWRLAAEQADCLSAESRLDQG